MCLDLIGVFLGLLSAEGASVHLFSSTPPAPVDEGVSGRLGGSIFPGYRE